MGHLELIVTVATALAAVLTGVMQLLKETELFPSKYTPLVALLVGVVAGLIASPLFGLSLYLGAISGFLAGLSSVGYYQLTQMKSNDQ